MSLLKLHFQGKVCSILKLLLLKVNLLFVVKSPLITQAVSQWISSRQHQRKLQNFNQSELSHQREWRKIQNFNQSERSRQREWRNFNQSEASRQLHVLPRRIFDITSSKWPRLKKSKQKMGEMKSWNATNFASEVHF